MKKRFLSICLLSVLAAAGCSGNLNQDPLADRPDPIRDGRPPGSKPQLPEPQPSEAVLVEGPEIFSLMEERTDSIEFKVRLLVPGYEGGFEVQNLEAFPGAQFDSQTGIFSWTPAKGTVLDGFYREMDLRILGYGVPEDEEVPPLVRLKIVRLLVHRKMTVPELKVESREKFFREGTNGEVTVTVTDPDGGAAADQSPEIIVLPPVGASPALKSLAGNVIIMSSSHNSTRKEWTFRLRVLMANEEFTSSSVEAGFRVRAINRFRQSSADALFRTRVYTRIGALSSTLPGNVEVVPGQDNMIPFLIYDEKGEALISLVNSSGIPAGAELSCAPAKPGILSCLFKWRPEYSRSGQTVSVILEFAGRNQDAADTLLPSNARFGLNLKVKQIPEITPPNEGSGPEGQGPRPETSLDPKGA